MRKIGIVGSRTYIDLEEVKWFIDTLSIDNTIIVSGGAIGVDRIAQQYAKKLHMKTKIFLPDWNKNGPSAGFIRNQLIVDYSDIIVAFWDGKSKGTYDTIKKTLKADKFILLFEEESIALIYDIYQIPLTN